MPILGKNRLLRLNCVSRRHDVSFRLANRDIETFTGRVTLIFLGKLTFQGASNLAVKGFCNVRRLADSACVAQIAISYI